MTEVRRDIEAACAVLARRDRALRAALRRVGTLEIRGRPGGFAGLSRIIVEQQVSVLSADAILKRIDAHLDRTDPAAVRAAGIEKLRNLGLSRPKARYIADLACLVDGGGFCFDDLAALDDRQAMIRLQTIRGVGPWTAAIYLLFCEGRADIWPTGDVALRGAYAAALSAPVSQAALDQKAVAFAPHRGVAAHILWALYAILKRRAPA